MRFATQVRSMLCSKFHRQRCLNLNVFSYQVGEYEGTADGESVRVSKRPMTLFTRGSPAEGLRVAGEG